MSVQGDVDLRRRGDIAWEAVHPHQFCCPGDTPRVGEYGYAAVDLRTKTVLRLAHCNTLRLGAPPAAGGSTACPIAGMREMEHLNREIEIAASLDPTHALIRSYLGKAYYQEERNTVAASQYDMAKRLDPNDPTLWCYHVIVYPNGKAEETRFCR